MPLSLDGVGGRLGSRLPWRVTLDAGLREVAHASLRRVAEGLQRRASDAPRVADGDVALFFGYLALETREQRWADQCRLHMASAFEAAAEPSQLPSLLGGYVGVAWTAEHLARLGVIHTDARIEMLDERLAQCLDVEDWNGNFDLPTGLVGIAVYGLELRDAARKSQIVSRAVEHLERLAIVRREGVSWWTLPRFLSAQALRQRPNGHVDLGLAHGVPGVLSLLARADDAGFGGAPIRSLLREGLKWTLAQAIREGGGDAIALPHHVAPNVPPVPARTAWCHGNPGAALALTTAARAVGDVEAEKVFARMARTVASVEPQVSGLRDRFFCHGAAGVAHTFQRLFALTEDPAFEDAARQWYGLAIPGVPPRESRTLRAGAAGIGLMLLAATSVREPSWDRVLLCSV
ncbi:hypothetical protein LVJ94_04835 [Pendulispora rubella]|uniref:Uncharacterized protein n=1 Tax=Pendulispora rubella TaxID=2741070 RepID=A0ABZ2LBI5_9BACT